MARSITRSIRSASLASDKDLASLMLRLMMSVNDISMANNAMIDWSSSQDSRKKGRRDSGLLYFGRMQTGHILEALGIIKEIAVAPKLRSYVGRCDTRTNSLFSRLENFNSSADYQLILRIRNNASFHYTGKLMVKSLERIVKESPRHVSLYSLGTEVLDWHFELADLVTDMIVVQEIFKLPITPTLRKDITVIFGRFNVMANTFADFAVSFVTHYH